MDAADIERATGMAAVDLKILAYLYQHDGEVRGPASLAKNLHRSDGKRYNRNYINNRLLSLSNVGLLEKPNRGEYRISEMGQEYVDGEIDATELTLE